MLSIRQLYWIASPHRFDPGVHLYDPSVLQCLDTCSPAIEEIPSMVLGTSYVAMCHDSAADEIFCLHKTVSRLLRVQ